MLLKTPGFTAVAVLTLALGIGANTAIFAFTDALLMRPLAGVSEPNRLIELLRTENDTVSNQVSYRDSIDYEEQGSTLSGIARVKRLGDVVVRPSSEPFDDVLFAAHGGEQDQVRRDARRRSRSSQATGRRSRRRRKPSSSGRLPSTTRGGSYETARAHARVQEWPVAFAGSVAKIIVRDTGLSRASCPEARFGCGGYIVPPSLLSDFPLGHCTSHRT